MATMSVSGIVSGMDWDSIINELITNAAKPAQVQVNKKTNLTNKKSLFEEMKVTMNSLQSSLTPLKLPSTYKAKEIDIERIDSNGSYKGVLTATVNADAEVNVYDLKVNQLARAQTNRSKQITSSVSGVLNDNGVSSGGTMYINMAGQRVGIEIGSSDTLQSIKSRINNTLKTLDIPVGVTASVVDNRLILRSDNTGLGRDTISETLTYNRNGYSNLTSFNVATQDAKNGDFVIRADGKQMTYGTDYDIVNGNEIRWNEYAETDNVKLGDKVSVTYTMAAGDSVTSTSTYKTSDTVNVKNALGFSPAYADNLKITTGSGTSLTKYTYGKDFTLDSDGNIKWLEESTTYNKPSGTYTVSLNGSASSETLQKNGSSNDTPLTMTFAQLEASYSAAHNGASVPTITPSTSGYTYIDDASIFTIDGYTYGKDYVVRKSVNGTGLAISWAGTGSTIYSAVGRYAEAKGIDTTGFTSPAANTSYELKYGEGGSVTLDSSTESTTNLSTALNTTNYSNLVVTDSDGKTYTYGTDFTVNTSTGRIEWIGTTENAGATQPGNDEEFNLVYTAGNAIVDDKSIDPLTFYGPAANGQYFSRAKLLDSTNGEITVDGQKYLSYEQIDAEAREQGKSVSDLFTIKDANKTYVYGTDYTIRNGGTGYTSTVDGSTVHMPLIFWKNQSADNNFTIAYTGRGAADSDESETITFDVERSNTDAILNGRSGRVGSYTYHAPLYSTFEGGTTTITQGSKTFYEGVDYDIVKTTTTDDNGDTITNASVEWKTGTNSEWYYPEPGAEYTINLTTANGTEIAYTATRNPVDALDLREHGFTSVNGSITSISFKGDDKTYTYDLTDTTTDDDGYTPAQNMARQLGLNVTDSTNGGFSTFDFNWTTPLRTANSNLPSYGSEITAEYTYNANTFTLEDDQGGKLLSAFELNLTDSDHYMAAQDAILELDGEKITRSSNDIGESYGNELIKGMTIHLKGVGEVSLDVSHDAQKAVESIQTFVDTYNDLMTWMNTRMTESEVDKDTAATIDSDDFRMRWGLLHGNSLLRQTKSRMRSIASQNFTFTFSQRTSAEEIYGTMAHNGLRNDATLRLRISNKFVDVAILPTDTLQDIVDKINDDSADGPMRDIYYDDSGNKLAQPLLKASIENDRLVINSTGNDSITMSGTSAMNALKMNYTYRGIYQLGIATTATDYGKSGELEFDTSKFMEALEDNPDEVQELMLMFANEFDTWTKSMLNSSASGETSGTLTRQIEDLESQISTIDEYLEKYQDRLDRMEESLNKKYANTETSLSKLSQQANSIAAILNQLNGYTNNSSSSS